MKHFRTNKHSMRLSSRIIIFYVLNVSRIILLLLFSRVCRGRYILLLHSFVCQALPQLYDTTKKLEFRGLPA